MILLFALAAGVLLIAGLIVILISLAPEPEPWVAPFPEPVDEEPFDPGAPVPPSDSVLNCGQPCFTVDQATTLSPGVDQLASLGAPALVAPAALAGTAREWEAEANGEYYLGDGDPQQCSFAVSRAPVVLHSQAYQTEDDPVAVIGEWSSESVSVSHVARVTESVLWGSRYPTLIRNAVGGCPGYTITIDGAAHEATLTPLDLDFAVAGVTDTAWTIEDGATRVTAADLQRGTIVLRIEVVRHTDAVSDEAVREYILAAAQQLSHLEVP